MRLRDRVSILRIVVASKEIHLVDEEGYDVDVGYEPEYGHLKSPGSKDAELTVTANYSPYYKEIFGSEGISWLYGKKAKDCIKKLMQGIDELGDEPEEDYWKATPGNAGFILSILLEWATKFPEATFKVY